MQQNTVWEWTAEKEAENEMGRASLAVRGREKNTDLERKNNVVLEHLHINDTPVRWVRGCREWLPCLELSRCEQTNRQMSSQTFSPSHCFSPHVFHEDHHCSCPQNEQRHHHSSPWYCHSHLHWRNTCEPFNTIVPPKLVINLRDLGLNTVRCDCILSSLMERTQSVLHLTLNTWAPRAACSALFYTLDCRATNSIIKFADDTTIIGLIAYGKDMIYIKEVRALRYWCQVNNPSSLCQQI